jgi:hypothetical protein
MSLFSDLADASVAHAAAVAGATFQLAGVEATFTGVIDAHRQRPKLGTGGFLEEVDALLVAGLAQFTAAAVTPKQGTRLHCAGRTYVVQDITTDDAAITFELKGVNQ